MAELEYEGDVPDSVDALTEAIASYLRGMRFPVERVWMGEIGPDAPLGDRTEGSPNDLGRGFLGVTLPNGTPVSIAIEITP